MSEKEILAKTYNSSEVEEPIYKRWLSSGAFHAVPDSRGPDRRYVVMMPLPNVTGALHMGHAMDNVMQDLLIRWHRMMGDNTLWMPGTDHAGIATQAVVEKRLKELEGLTRHDVGRDGLVERIWRWKDQYQSRIIEQQQRMGCSCDWKRQRFTMDAVCAGAVRHAFFRMFSDSLIFRGKRLVNWDVYLRTTISDDEMYYETINGYFWHLVYPVIDPQKGEPENVVVATTRPETMLGDTAVAVHPDPEKALNQIIKETEEQLSYVSGAVKAELEEKRTALEERKNAVLPRLLLLRDMALDGRKVNLPLLDRPIPLITDEWAKPELGSGCVKITPAHDYNDYDVWMRHRDMIDIINILNSDGTLNENAGPYAGLDRFQAREAVVSDLKAQGLLEKTEEREVEIGHSDRSKTPVEPFLSDQWFIKMGDVDGGILMGRGTKKEFSSPGLVQAAMDAVSDGRVAIHPERYTKTYLDWLSEKRDWPISRQLWWGHRIPVWSKTYEAGALGNEKVFAEIAEYLKHKNSEEEEVLVGINAIDTERGVLFHEKELGGLKPPAWHREEACRIDVCLLSDTEGVIRLLEEHGFEQDKDVLDTWFSSALWPFSTLGWPSPETAEIEEGEAVLGAQNGSENCLDYYYPGSCLVTARDIITLWVARMVLAGLYCLGDVPFTDVFIHANILDGKGVRMSKSKGNGIDPVDIIGAYGTDAMRYVLCDMQTGTQDIRLPVTAVCPECGYHNDLGITKHGSSIFCYVCGKNTDGSLRKGACGKEFDVLGTLPHLKQATLISERFETGRAFCTKLWNSARFVFMNLGDPPDTDIDPDELLIEDRWILGRLSETIREVTHGLEIYNPSYAMNAVREFFWSNFCDWYLELAKPRLYNKTDVSRDIACRMLTFVMDVTLRLLHPFIPFMTEYLWQKLGTLAAERGLGTIASLSPSRDLITAAWPRPLMDSEDGEVVSAFSILQEIVRAVRDIRADRSVPPKQKLTVTLDPQKETEGIIGNNIHVLKELAGIETVNLQQGAKRMPGSASKIAGGCQLFVHDIIDDELEKKRLKEALLKANNEIDVCRKKLENKNFIERAPRDVVQKQRDRLSDCLADKDRITKSLKELE
ncbi:MAG: valine--tRNA ligase [Spirochaetales bacterium]|nr:valine--tRNA ligase [Spirochaetales bacterium]